MKFDHVAEFLGTVITLDLGLITRLVDHPLHLLPGGTELLFQPAAPVGGALAGQQHVHDAVRVVLGVHRQLHQPAGFRGYGGLAQLQRVHLAEALEALHDDLALQLLGRYAGVMADGTFVGCHQCGIRLFAQPALHLSHADLFEIPVFTPLDQCVLVPGLEIFDGVVVSGNVATQIHRDPGSALGDSILDSFLELGRFCPVRTEA